MASPDEDNAVQHVTERLRQAFPNISGDDVTRVVHSVLDSYRSSPVRDYIPVLIEREARAQLNGRAQFAT